MSEVVYSLDSLPMGRPCVVYHALKYIDQQILLQLVRRTTPYSRAQLLPLIDRATHAGAIRAVKADVPTSGRCTFVDLNTFPDEFTTFVTKVQKHELEISVAEIRRLLEHKQGNKNTLKQKILASITTKPRLLALIESVFCSDLNDYFRIAYSSPFRPGQISQEIKSLLNLLQEKRPKSILEIGTDKGGTLYLFSKVADPGAILASVDIKLNNGALIASFARHKQVIKLLEGDSTHPSTLKTLRTWFPNGIDFLFIDGDHTYEGVKQDFQSYAPWVNPGGLIAFHDIVEDNETRYNVITGGWAGGVPRFWREVKTNYQHVEFIKDCQQSGLGIGVLFVKESK